jgi:hypothetical protein
VDSTSSRPFRNIQKDRRASEDPECFEWRVVHFCLDRIGQPFLTCFVPFNDCEDVHPVHAFDEHLHAFAAVDASVIPINRLKVDRQDHYSGKNTRHWVTIQALVNEDGQCLDLSNVDRGKTHDKALFDRSRVVEFLTYREHRGNWQQKAILTNCHIILDSPFPQLPQHSTSVISGSPI